MVCTSVYTAKWNYAFKDEKEMQSHVHFVEFESSRFNSSRKSSCSIVEIMHCSARLCCIEWVARALSSF